MGTEKTNSVSGVPSPGFMCEELARALEASVMRNRCEALLLSGGLDSSILASILRPKYAVTCSLGENAPDVAFARLVGEKFCSSIAHEKISFEEMLALVEEAVQIFKTFDPIEIRNSVVALGGMERAKSDGYSEVMTGDGGDELFAGYNYLLRYYPDLQKIDSEVRRLWKVMHFSSEKIGEHLGIRVRAPYLDSEFMEFAKSVPLSEKLGERAGEKWGKFILRKCYEPVLGELIAWRPKFAQEQGAGTSAFQAYIDQRIDDLTFSNRSEAARNEGVLIRNKEHLHYYALFRSHFPAPKSDEENAGCKFRCPSCKGRIEADGRFCRTCGAYPVTPEASL
jgi:asparagine synthase (glutamine-hydrolysing)